MPSRRSHTKSHHGCRQCKARRVKCDETSPQCHRCLKRQIACSFLEDGSEGFPTPLGSTTVYDTATPKSVDFPASEADRARPRPVQAARPRTHVIGDHHPSGPVGDFDQSDLELIHYWSTRTYITMSSRLSTHVVWRDTIFAEGLRHDFLLHGLMATAALHKATTQPKSSDAYARYSKVALAHQDAALAGYIPAVSHPTQQNGIALFSLSLLLTIWAFASKRLPEGLNGVKLDFGQATTSPGITLPLNSPTADFIEIIMILRGIHAVIRETNTWLQGEIEELLRYPRSGDLPPHPADVTEAFQVLAKAVDDPHLATQLGGDDPATTRAVCVAQLDQLRDISRCRSVVEWDGHIFSWLIMAPAPFIHCLKQGHSLPLALFAHWAAMFRCMDHHWWAQGWAYSLVVDISSLLDPSWSPYMDWPRRQVGLVFQETPGFDARRVG